MGQKKPKVSTQPKNIINSPQFEKNNDRIIFSFQYLDLKSKKYSLDNIIDKNKKSQYINDFFNKIKEYSELNNFKKDIIGRYSDINHIHPINWKDNRIRESNFNCLKKELMEQIKDECWQLGINHYPFRIHGFFVGNVFYVVWLDPEHNLYYMK